MHEPALLAESISKFLKPAATLTLTARALYWSARPNITAIFPLDEIEALREKRRFGRTIGFTIELTDGRSQSFRVRDQEMWMEKVYAARAARRAA